MEVPPSWYAALVSNHLNWMATSHRKPMHLWAKPVWNQSIDKHFMIILQWTDNVMPTGCNNPWFLWIKTLESAQVNPLIIIVAVFVDHVTSCYIPSNPMVKTPYINPCRNLSRYVHLSVPWLEPKLFICTSEVCHSGTSNPAVPVKLFERENTGI